MRIPAVVAMPLPPRNFKKGLYMCPNKDKKAEIIYTLISKSL